MARHPLSVPAGVDEDESRAVLTRELRETIVHLGPDVPRHDRLERRRRYLDLEIAPADVARVDDCAVRLAIRTQLARADEKPRDVLDGSLRCGESDARQPLPGECLQPLEREREVEATLAADH